MKTSKTAALLTLIASVIASPLLGADRNETSPDAMHLNKISTQHYEITFRGTLKSVKDLDGCNVHVQVVSKDRIYEATAKPNENGAYSVALEMDESPNGLMDWKILAERGTLDMETVREGRYILGDHSVIQFNNSSVQESSPIEQLARI
jgi:hypothetical protein